MRPIHLSVSGLHSFREQQEVDFLTLCEGGVFGIFGPTGSGKSSLLDAITLALYGTVERANNNTQGIMNHAEDQIQVSFTFELGNAHGSMRYRVERSFKRTGEVTIRTATCRLLQLADETIVLADKNNELNQKVQELLGLTIDDFTRAVVLPQGKFAEFLSLKGSDRRQMLQRLFHLEQYGDLLNEKLRLKIGALKGKLSEVIAEQQGLGDASKEALAAAKQRVSKSESIVKDVEQQKKQIEQDYESQRNIWQWQEELNKAEQELKKLEEQRDMIVGLEQRLQGAEEAQQVKPYMEEWEEAQKEYQKWLAKQKQTLQELVEVKKQEEQYAQAYQQTVKEREEQQPHWIERQAELKQSQVLQKDIEQLEKESQSLAQEMGTDQKREAEHRTALDNTKAILVKATTKQKELKQELDRLSVSVEERERVRSANTDQAAILNLEQNLQGLREDNHKKQQEIQKHERALGQAKEQNLAYFRQAKTLLEKITDMCSQFDQSQQCLVNQLMITQKWQEEQEKNAERQKERDLAIQLAKQLRTGEHCPVCGSTDHPQPVANDHHNWQHHAAQLEEVKTWVQKAKEQQHTLQNGKLRLEQLFEDVCDAFSDSNTEEFKQLSLLNEKTSSQIAATSEDADENINLTLLIDELKQLLDHCQVLEKDIPTIPEESRRLTRAYREEAKKQAEIVITLSSLRKDEQDRLQKLKQLQTDIEGKRVSWKQTYPQYRFERIAEEQTKLDQNDREFTTIKKRIDQSVDFIEEKEKEIEQAQESLRLLHLQQVERSSIHKQKQELLNQKQQLLKEQIGSENVDLLLQEAAKKLVHIKEQEQRAEQLWQKSRELLQIKEREESVAAESLKQAEKRQQKAADQWKEVSAESSFSDIDQVKEALGTKEAQADWKKEIQHYRDLEKKWSQEQSRLQSLLDERKLTLEQWQECVRQREQIGEKWDQSLQEQGAAKQALRELETKHQRYLELEEVREESEHSLEKLGKLQSVFRGNSFVEFVAEEQLMQICREASQRLGALTRQRYALEVDSTGGFIIRDDANGGVKRPVTSLSGGETFLTSLALALSLSAQIQLRGEYPLEFFFLDEGFGTLDHDLLDTVVTALEHLHTDRLTVGVISHVPELRSRLPRRIVVEPAEASGRGSRVYLETL
jgi:exonuclease SbcC